MSRGAIGGYPGLFSLKLSLELESWELLRRALNASLTAGFIGLELSTAGLVNPRPKAVGGGSK
jgi:hypothetical protein